MIQPSLFLRRVFLLDAIFSGMMAVLLTLGAGALASWLELPEALLRETGLFLIAYTALVGWLATRQSMPKALGGHRHRRQCGMDGCQHRAVVLRRRDAEPAWPGLCRRAGRSCPAPWPNCNISDCAGARTRWRPKPRPAGPDPRPSRWSRASSEALGLAAADFWAAALGRSCPFERPPLRCLPLASLPLCLTLAPFSFCFSSSFSFFQFFLSGPSPPAFRLSSRPSSLPWPSGATVRPSPRRAFSCASSRRRRICIRSASDTP